MVPDYQTIMLPLLQFTSDNQPHKFRDSIEALSKHFNLTEKEKKILLPSGTQALFDNRVGWARFYLTKAGLLKSIKRGTHQITEQRLKYLSTQPKKITTKDLEQIKEFQEFLTAVKKGKGTDEEKDISNGYDKDHTQTPEEALEYAYLKIKKDLSRDLIETIKNCSPSFFEKLVIDLLIKMGYGGSRKDAGKAIGRSGDGGIDGMIKEDKLGLDAIYNQAKKWDNPVPVREIRDFAGALLSKKARKGIFISTSNFPNSAYDFVKSIEHKIILIDGEKLTDLMFEYNVGLSIQSNYEIKKIDSDYFEE